MKMKKFIIAILCLLVLSPAISRAEIIEQNFHTMNAASQIRFSGNKVGETDFVTYTCSGGSNAIFFTNSGKLCICLPNYGNQVVTSPPIANLDSLSIYYFPTDSYRTIKAYTSVNSVDWTEVTVKQATKGGSTIQLPSTGNYYLKFANESGSSFYIWQINYFTKPSCACLKVVIE